jgi:hypothetical protein
LKKRPDIPGQEQNDGQQVPDRNVSGCDISIQLAFCGIVTISGARCLVRSYAFPEVGLKICEVLGLCGRGSGSVFWYCIAREKRFQMEKSDATCSSHIISIASEVHHPAPSTHATGTPEAGVF